MQRKSLVTVVVVAALAAAGAVFLVHRSRLEAAVAPTAETPAVPVVAGVVASHPVPIYLTGVGTVVAYNTVVVRSQIQGQIVNINFKEGQTVKTGDLLAQIDPRPYQAQIDQMT